MDPLVHGFFSTPTLVLPPAPSLAGCDLSCPGRETFTIWTQKVVSTAVTVRPISRRMRNCSTMQSREW